MTSAWKTFFSTRFFIFGAFLAVAVLGAAYTRAYFRAYEIKQEIARLQAESGRLETKKLESLKMLEYIKSLDFAEVKARTELNLIKLGEEVAVVEPALEKGYGQENKRVLELDKVSNLLKWLKLFINFE